MAKECFGTFRETKEDCYTCKENIGCLEVVAPCKSDFTIPEKRARCYAPCEHRDTCNKLTDFYFERHAHCINFGEPEKNTIVDCARCPNLIFKECELAEFQIKNLNRTRNEAETTRKMEIEDLREELDTCFEHFDTDSDSPCWVDCSYLVRCLKESQILPDGKCKMFPATNVEIDDPFTIDLCKNCLFLKSCKIIYEGRVETQKKKIDERKIFTNFFTITQIRDEFMYEEE